MARVILNGNKGVNWHKEISSSFVNNDEEDVQSGSETGFSDSELDDKATARATKNTFDQVTQILDRIDTELISLTRSNGSASTSSTDNIVIRRHGCETFANGSKIENGDNLTIGELGTNFKPTMSFQSLGSQTAGTSNRDTSIEAGTSSYPKNGLQLRNAAPNIRHLELENYFKGSRNNRHHQRSCTSPEMVYLNGHLTSGQSDDDKSRQKKFTTLPLEAKQVDEKFKEIMQKRTGGFLASSSGEDSDHQTIWTEDFCEKFKDNMVYSSATGSGTQPVYPKLTLSCAALQSSLKSVVHGHKSDGDSVKTEDTDKTSRGTMVANGNRNEESDLDTVSNDPIHIKVKQILKATAKYKPNSNNKNKSHVRVSPNVLQYPSHNKGGCSDDTLYSDKDCRVSSPSDNEKLHDNTTNDGHESDTRKEIARESDRILREMEQERYNRSLSPIRDRSPTRTYLSLISEQSKTVYDKGDKSISNAGGDKSLFDQEKERTAELKATQNALDVTECALLEAQKNLKDVQTQYKYVRTQLVLLEHKKENTTKELSTLWQDLRRKQSELESIDTQVKRQQEEIKHFDAIGFTKDEATKLIEANKQMKNQMRNLDAVYVERDELIQQLDSAKRELFTEQKQAQTKIEELNEELENVTSAYEQIQAAYKKMEKEKNELIQDKMKYEEEMDKHKAEKTEWRKLNMDEVESIRQDLIRATNKVASLQDEVRSKEELNLQLRDQLLELQQTTQEDRTSHRSILEEHKKTLQVLRKETDAAMVQLRESLFLEKQKTIDAMRNELDQERRKMIARSEERFQAQIADQDSIIKAKNERITQLAKLIDTKVAQTRNKVQMDEDIKLQIQEAVDRERINWVIERDSAIAEERENLQREYQQQIKHLKVELTCMSKEQKSLETMMKEQQNELQDLKTTNKAVVHEKLIAITQAKELMRKEQQVEIERITEQMKKEHKIEIEKLKETIRIQDEELCQLRKARLRFLQHNEESNCTLESTERTLIAEINDECRNASELLGLSPRKVIINSYPDKMPSPSPKNSSIAKHPSTLTLPRPADELFLFTQAQDLVYHDSEANLHASNEELQKHVTDLQHKFDEQRNSVNIADRQKNETLTVMKRQLEKEKEDDMAKLKDKLVKGLLNADYRTLLYSPDNDGTMHRRYKEKSYHNECSLKKMSYQQQQDLDRLEREINKLAMSNDRETSDQRDVDYGKRLAQLHANVRQLQVENSSLHRSKLNVSSSNPDLTTFDRNTRDQLRSTSALEVKMQEHWHDTETLTEHQRKNRDVMSRKMAEMSKLQNTLTDQAKELIQLEKAYAQLNKYAKSPRQSSSTMQDQF